MVLVYTIDTLQNYF